MRLVDLMEDRVDFLRLSRVSEDTTSQGIRGKFQTLTVLGRQFQNITRFLIVYENKGIRHPIHMYNL